MPTSSYSNVTLVSQGGDLSVVVYLPIGIKKDEEAFYYSSRFDHGSMIGSITRKKRKYFTAKTPATTEQDGGIDAPTSQNVQRKSVVVDTHVLYGTDTWRLPHNSHWPESGVGLASEFGAGDDGNLCFFRCGWPSATDVTNGVLGYQEASNGESFLKIGVGELIKGTCPACDSTDDYRYNSPYMMARRPVWNMSKLVKNSKDEFTAVQLEHTAKLDNHGYYLRKDVSLSNNILSVTTTLQNLGMKPFSTVWYSHHLFSCDGVAVGPGYTLDVNLQGHNRAGPIYAEPGTWSWATPLEQYGHISAADHSIRVDMDQTIGPGSRIKVEFSDDHATDGGFTLHACDTSVEARLQSDDFASGLLQMYAYNMYLERGTFSPIPQLLLSNLQPQQTASWTLQLVISDDSSADEDVVDEQSVDHDASLWWTNGMATLEESGSVWRRVGSMGDPHPASAGFILCCCCFFILTMLVSWTTRYRRRRQYDHII